MGFTLTATFETRREAELAIEHLVQEHGVKRTDSFVAAAAEENTAGSEGAGSDTEAGAPSPEDHDDAALNGNVEVSVDIEDDDLAEAVRAIFDEFGALTVNEG